jgi:hypothetical protein
MNWKLSIFAVSLLTSLVQANVAVNVTFVEKGCEIVDQTIVLAQDMPCVVTESEHCMTLALRTQDSAGAVVAVNVCKNDSEILATELSMVWGKEAIVQTEEVVDSQAKTFMKLVCIAQPADESMTLDSVHELSSAEQTEISA